MQTADREVHEQLSRWLSQGERAWLCTVVGTIGSSPRPAGSIAAISADGQVAGSLSGGCVEEDLVERLAAGEYDGKTPALIEFGVSAEENERLGLPCGGRIELLLQALNAADLDWVQGVLEALSGRRCICRQVDLDTGSTTLSPVDAFESLVLSDTVMKQCFGPRMRMLLVGAGQLAHSLAELAAAMDYEVLVTDPRREVLERWTGPEVTLLPGMPDDAAAAHAADANSLVITLTHDPRIDDMALMQALTSDAWYVGALGSLRTTRARLQRLRDLELPQDAIERLHAPVGLDIGSKTPIEIAVSIMAQVTALRRRR